jgi:integrase
MIYKRCHEAGCESPNTCKHPYHVEVTVKGDRAKGPITKYIELWPKDAPPLRPHLKGDADKMEGLIKGWLLNKRRQSITPEPPPSTPTPPSSGVTIGDAIKSYEKGHKLKDKSAPSILKRITDHAGDEPIAKLADALIINDLLSEVMDETSVANRNRHLSRWSHLFTWCRAQGYKTDLAGLDSPFHHKHFNPGGIRKLPEGDGRDRRLESWEDIALEKFFAALDDGGMMLARYHCALDCGLRRGEMLLLRKEHVKRNYKGSELILHVPGEITKTGKPRDVVVASDRMRAFLDTRRFAQFTFGQKDGTQVSKFREEWEAALIATGIDKGHWSKETKVTPAGHRYKPWVRTRDGNLHWHDFRHEAASRMAENGVDAAFLMVQLGHRDLKTSQRYINTHLAKRDEAIRRSAVAQGL